MGLSSQYPLPCQVIQAGKLSISRTNVQLRLIVQGTRFCEKFVNVSGSLPAANEVAGR